MERRRWTVPSGTVGYHIVYDSSHPETVSQVHALLPGLANPVDPGQLAAQYATVRGQVVGAAYLYRLGIHPTRWRLNIRVVPDERRQGIGTALFNSCLHDSSLQDGAEIQVALSSADGGELAFFRSLEFGTLMTTHLGTLPWQDTPEALADNGPAEITTLAQHPELREEVANVHERIYRSQHAWSPVGELTEQFKTSVFLDPDELVPEAQFIAMIEGHVVGVASLRAPFSIASPDLGWIGVIDALPDSTAHAIHAQLLDACLQFARMQKADISVEIDEADTKTLKAFQNLNVEWESEWLKLVRKV
jgi:GNAT superfamily N-acetyltransferase